jgi:spore germination cell wall hydrolase CwlJ-like protein
MPQFTQWNVPDPFPNILYNPAAVDAAIAKTQSELGNLDINRQHLALEQAREADAMAGGKRLIDSLTNNTKGTTGAGVGGTYEPGTPFTPKMLPPGVSLDEDAMVRTIAGEAGNEPLTGQIAVAHVINTRAKSAGVSPRDVVFSPNQFEPWNGGAARARLEAMQPTDPQYQAILNNVVRPAMSGKAADPTGGATHFYAPVAQKALGREAPSWGQGTPSAVIGGHNFYKVGYGPGQARVAAAPDATPVVAPGAAQPGMPQAAPGVVPPTAPGVNPNAKVNFPPTTPIVAAPAANPNAGPRVGAAPTVPAVTPAIAPSADPNARVEADDPNTAAVKQAATALLNMPEPDAAAAYPTVVRELQARGFAMQAPPEYPGHAALQALVGGVDAVAQTKTAMRLGGTDVADASGVVVPTAAPAAPRPNVILDESGKPLQAPPPAPNKMMAGTGLPGVTIGLPGNTLAPPPTTQTAAAPTAAPATQAKPPVLQPPPALQRAIPPKPVLPSGLTAADTEIVAGMVQARTPMGQIATFIEAAKQRNTALQQQYLANQAAVDQANFERQKYYTEQQQKTGWEDAGGGMIRNKYTGETKYAGPPTPRIGTDTASGRQFEVMPGGEMRWLTENPSGITGTGPEASALRTLNELAAKKNQGIPLTPQEEVNYSTAADVYQGMETIKNDVTKETVQVPKRPLPPGIPEPQGRGGAGAGGGPKVVLPGLSPAQQQVERDPAAYKVAESQYDRDSKEIGAIGDVGRQAQADQVRIKEMQDVLQRFSTGSGTEARTAASNWLQRWLPASVTGWEKESANLSGSDAAQAFSKMALVGAGTQERGVLGARGGYQAIRLFKEANPSVNLQDATNKSILDMQLISNQANQDYSQAALSHFADNETKFGQTHQYASLAQFDRAWNGQRNPQVYAGAMGAISGQPYEQWSKGLQEPEIKRALDIVSRANPSAVVNSKSGPISMQPPSTSTTPAPPTVGTVQGGFRFKGGNPASPTSWEPAT